MTDKWITRRTLLQRAQDPADEKAWADFVKYYESFIHVVLHQMSFNRAEFDDVTQDILLKIWKHFQKFDAEKHQVRFRTWLSTLIRNMVITHINKKKKTREKQESHQEEVLTEMNLIPQNELDSIVQKQWEKHITNQAMENIRPLFSGQAIDVFELSLLGKTAKEISQSLSLNQDSIRTLKNRVKIRLIKEINALRTELEF